MKSVKPRGRQGIYNKPNSNTVILTSRGLRENGAAKGESVAVEVVEVSQEIQNQALVEIEADSHQWRFDKDGNQFCAAGLILPSDDERAMLAQIEERERQERRERRKNHIDDDVALIDADIMAEHGIGMVLDEVEHLLNSLGK